MTNLGYLKNESSDCLSFLLADTPPELRIRITILTECVQACLDMP